MGVDAINTQRLEGSPALTPRTQMGKEDFLKLLVAQLSHQDPLKPTDGTAFVAELAQFSNLEQMVEANNQLNTIAQLSGQTRDSQSYTLLGRVVSIDSGTLHLNGLSGAEGRFTLAQPATEVEVVFSDASGMPVRRLALGALPSGSNSIAWDGLTEGGERVPPGSYRMSIRATNDNGGAIASDTLISGVVDRVLLENGTTWLEVGGNRVALSDVKSVK